MIGNKMNRDSGLRDLEDKINMSKICVVGVPEGEEWENGQQNI